MSLFSGMSADKSADALCIIIQSKVSLKSPVRFSTIIMMFSNRNMNSVSPRDGDCSMNGDHPWDMDHPRDGEQLLDGNPTIEIFVNLECIIYHLNG